MTIFFTYFQANGSQDTCIPLIIGYGLTMDLNFTNIHVFTMTDLCMNLATVTLIIGVVSQSYLT